MEGKNEGHGHVYKRPDGVRARCGGPAMCSECAHDLAQKMADEAARADDRDARIRAEGFRAGAEAMREAAAAEYLRQVETRVIGRNYGIEGLTRMQTLPIPEDNANG